MWPNWNPALYPRFLWLCFIVSWLVLAKIHHVNNFPILFVVILFAKLNFYDIFSYIRACGNNDGKLPLSISSFKNEFAIFFRSSLKDNFKGLHCRYKVIPEPLGKKKAFEKYDQFDKVARPYLKIFTKCLFWII